MNEAKIKAAAKCLGITIYAIHPRTVRSPRNGLLFTGEYSYHPGWREILSSKFTGDTLSELHSIGAALYKTQIPYVFALIATVGRAGAIVVNRHTLSPIPDGRADAAVVDALWAFSRWAYKNFTR